MSSVKQTRMGRSGLSVSNLCIGTTYFGTDIEAAEAIRIMELAADRGINFLDTADAYSMGMAEEVIGRFAVGRRDDLVISSKAHIPMSDKPNDGGSSRKHILKSIDKSLARLNTDYVDIYMLHYYDDHCPLDESLRAMEDVVASGKARYLGVSNFSGSQLVNALWLNDAGGYNPVAVAQTRYNALNRESEYELLPACEQFGVGVMAYSPQAGGFLLGKHRKFKAAAGSHMNKDHYDSNFHRNTYWNQECFDSVEKILDISAKYKVDLINLAIGWVLQSPIVTSAVVGVKTAAQLENLLDALAQAIPPEAMAAYSAVADEIMMNIGWRGVGSWQEANKST